MEVQPAGFADGLDVEERKRAKSRSGMTFRVELEPSDEWG